MMTTGGQPGSSAGRVLEAAPSEIRPILRRLLEEPPADLHYLASAVKRHLEILEGAVAAYPRLDLPTARLVARRCQALLEGLTPTTSPDIRRLVQVAVRYFVEHDDADDDVDSPTGFDDDAEVVAIVASEIGREDVLSIA